MKWIKEIICFFLGHDWTEFTERRVGSDVFYKDRKCGTCGKTEVLRNNYCKYL